MATTLYGIPNCDTVKKARAWLAAQGHVHAFHDFKRAGVPTARLSAWVAAVGWERLLNRQGTTWRKLDAAAQAAVVDADSAQALMRRHPSLIRRPVIECGSEVRVGFDAGDWQRLLA
jgi:Spx/MgsR family transcriptional regulator